MSVTQFPELPITEVLEDIRVALLSRHELILEAPPGAGKTTLVPLALLAEPWLDEGRILILQPRRMAARTAAARMASLLGEKTGETVGFRVRQETSVSAHTRIEVITEGILNRMLLEDPSLSGVALIIFDEFHERSLDADTGLALALQGRSLFREADQPLKILLMSATLHGEALTRLLPNAAVIRSEGRMFPVDIHYDKPMRYDDNIVTRAVDMAHQAINRHAGNLLVFLPGQGEILRAQSRLREQLPADIIVLPLYGSLPLQQQKQALEPAAQGSRKIVLATDIAETSLTIEGITVVIDSGLCRQPEFDPNSAMTRLHTCRISQDSATQRAGRAGRLSAGHCYRLWSEEQQQQLAKHRSPEILQADLAPLMLQLIAWGVDDLRELHWLDLPPQGATLQALALLQQLGAIEKAADSNTLDNNIASNHLNQWRITHHGETVNQLPTHPRLAHMLIAGHRQQLTEQACAMAAMLSERSPLHDEPGADLSRHLDVICGTQRSHSRHQAWLQRVRQQAARFRQILLAVDNGNTDKKNRIDEDDGAGFLLACAYPERLARRKGAADYQLANGQFATLAAEDSLSQSTWLAIAELGGVKQAGQSRQVNRIFSAAAFNPALLEDTLRHYVTATEVMAWDEKNHRFIAEHQQAVGKLLLNTTPIANPSAEIKRTALLALVRKLGLALLPWDNHTRQWQARVQLLHQLQQDQLQQQTPPADQLTWPDVSDQALLDTLEGWLGPFLNNINKLEDFKRLDLPQILATLLPWPLPRHLDEMAPQKITVPSGSSYNIDYLASPPVLSVKLQEMFGCVTTPSIAHGKVKLMLHLLSPAQRPLQVTQDLAGFWQSSYFDVRREMKGRYPKHPWPDDPMAAQATRRIKAKIKTPNE